MFSLDAHGVLDREPSSLVIPALERFEEQGIPWLICSYAVKEDTKRRVRDCLARLLGRLDFSHPQPAGRQYRVPLLFTATKTKRGTGKPDRLAELQRVGGLRVVHVDDSEDIHLALHSGVEGRHWRLSDRQPASASGGSVGHRSLPHPKEREFRRSSLHSRRSGLGGKDRL